jgi:hypothetical protein
VVSASALIVSTTPQDIANGVSSQLAQYRICGSVGGVQLAKLF